MHILYQTIRLTLPVAFFGYALVANATLIGGLAVTPVLPVAGLLSGGLTRDLDASYKTDLPHMALSSDVIGAARYVLLGEARQGAVAGRNGWLFSAEEMRPRPTADALAAIVATITHIQTRIDLAGGALVVVPVPAKVDLARDQAPDPRAADAQALLYADFRAALAAQDVAVVDARRVLQTTGEAVFFTTDTHWTPAGAALVASAVRDHRSVAAGDLRYARTAPVEQDLTGDLVSFVTSAAIAAHIGLPPETVGVAVQTPNQIVADIFGTAATDIVLVGTSYSANADWGFADALMAALGRDVINMAQQGLGPLQPMQDYLASDDFRDRPPALVIWEMPVRYLSDAAIWPDSGLRAPDRLTLAQGDGP